MAIRPSSLHRSSPPFRRACPCGGGERLARLLAIVYPAGLRAMDLLVYWRWDNYRRDLDDGAGFNFNSNQRRLHTAIEPGERLWAVTGHHSGGTMRYALAAVLAVTAKTFNPPGFKYGRHRVWGDTRHSAYYAVPAQADMAHLLLRLEFAPRSTIESRPKIGQSLQTLRSLTPGDSALLAA